MPRVKPYQVGNKNWGQILEYNNVIPMNQHIVPLNLTLEHIIPQKAKEPIINSKNMDKIGNLTLLEGKNSDKIGHKGNSSIQNKLYKDKLNSYKESSVKVTRELAVLHNAFSESTIQES